jgi:phosphoserine phosphatase
MNVICFDFDDVIVKTNTVNRLVKLFGHRLKVFKVEVEFLEDNMKPDKFFEVIKKIVHMGKGLEFERVKKYMIRFGLNKGAHHTLSELKKRGYKIVIVSTNDERIIKEFLTNHGLDKYIDHIYASRIGVKNGIITGQIYGDVVRTEKTGVVNKIKSKYGVNPANIIYVGDGLTDLPVMKLVGYSILFCPNKLTKIEVMNNSCLHNKEKEGGLIVIKKRDLREVLRFVE